MLDVRKWMTGKACAALVLAVAIAGCIGLATCSSTAGGSSTSSTSATEAKASTSNADTSYADKLFDTSTVHTIDIAISDEDWADLKANPLEKTKYQVDATIDGEKASQISFATKGNTSLSSVATDEGSDRYSFKINFGKYVDGQLSSYSDIFDNAETDVDEADEQRVVTAMKQLSEGNVDSALDTDEVIRYFAAHTFVMSYDSYTGMMLHNYYLYEDDGKLSMLPWDYNLAFGAFSMGGASSGDSGEADATSLVNCGIDTPLSGASEADRPMWSWITSNEEYLERYHELYNELLTNYFESGGCQAEIESVRAMIAPYVENDASAFYTTDQFNTAVDTLESFVATRAESIRAQLDGKLSTKTSEQDKSAQVDGKGIDIKAMGSQSRGR